MNVGQLYSLANNDLAIPKYVGKTHIIYDVWLSQGDCLDLHNYTRNNADLESSKTIDEFKKLVKVETQLFDNSYIQ